MEKLDPAVTIHKSFLPSFQDLACENIWPVDKGSECGGGQIFYRAFWGKQKHPCCSICWFPWCTLLLCPDTNGLSTSSQNPLVFTNWASELVSVNSGAPLSPRLEDCLPHNTARHGVWFHRLTHASFSSFTKLTLMKCLVTEMGAKKINLILWGW